MPCQLDLMTGPCQESADLPHTEFQCGEVSDIPTNLHSVWAFLTRVPGLQNTSDFGAASIDSRSYDTVDS